MTQPAGLKAVHLRIEGRVQGVGFRRWMKREADGLGLRGWARNTPDAAIEAVVAGEEDAVAAFCEAATRGPHNARVNGLAMHAVDDEPSGPGFRVL